MNQEPERGPETGEPRGHTRFRGREGLRSLVLLLFVLATVACLFLVGRFGK